MNDGDLGASPAKSAPDETRGCYVARVGHVARGMPPMAQLLFEIRFAEIRVFDVIHQTGVFCVLRQERPGCDRGGDSGGRHRATSGNERHELSVQILENRRHLSAVRIR